MSLYDILIDVLIGGLCYIGVGIIFSCLAIFLGTRARDPSGDSGLAALGVAITSPVIWPVWFYLFLQAEMEHRTMLRNWKRQQSESSSQD